MVARAHHVDPPVEAHATSEGERPDGAEPVPVRDRRSDLGIVGDKLLVVRESGEMMLAPATPQGFKPVARAQVLPGVLRPLPAIADGFVYLRNENTLVCLDLRR